MKGLAKILVKLNQNKWVHFCYVQNELKLNFDTIANKDYNTSDYWINRWSLEDFGVPFSCDSIGLITLKRKVKSMYSEKYPEVYLEDAGKIDTQGWLRVWCQHHMKKEIEYAQRSK